MKHDSENSLTPDLPPASRGCPFNPECAAPREWQEPIDHHLVITIATGGKAHLHGPLDNVEVLKTMAGHLLAKIKELGG